jgi:hypothetical protein
MPVKKKLSLKTLTMKLLLVFLHALSSFTWSLGSSFHAVNERVFRRAPSAWLEFSSTSEVSFFGGRDDREALAYGMRMHGRAPRDNAHRREICDFL